jgi:integrase
MSKALTDAALTRLKPAAGKRREVPDGLMTGLYFVIQPSGARSWAVRYRAAGAPKKLTLGTYPALGLDDARTEAQAALLAAKRGADPAAAKAEHKRAERSGETADRLGFDAVARRYLSRDAKKNRSWLETARLLGLKPGAEGSEDPKTFVSIPGGIVADWADRMISEIKRGEIIERLDAIVDRGAPIAANRTLAALRRLFNWTVERGLLEVSPCSAVKAPSPEISRDRVLSDDEVRWAWQAAGGMGYPFGPIVKLLLLTGQRRDEVAGMSEHELDGAVWTIPGARAKNRQQHAVPLAPTSVAIIGTAPKIKGAAKLVFTTTGESAVSGWSRAKANLDAAMTQIARKETGDADLTIPAWTLHDLRRTAASGMARLGIAVHVVEKLLNHRSGTIKGVAAVYNRHSYWDERVAAAGAWASYLDHLVSGQPMGNVRQLRTAGAA